MDAIVDKTNLLTESQERALTQIARPSREEAEAAVRTLIAWAGDNPQREGLIDTPKRVAKAFREWFKGYELDPAAELGRVFEEVEGYDDMVMLTNIDVESHCEHHLAPILGTACVAYMPDKAVVGISKIAKVVEIFSKRLQTQETMTAQIADAIENAMQPRGVAVFVDAKHQCMTTRGVHHPNVSTITTRFTGEFRANSELRERFMRLCEQNKR
ncbi:GTP cyclohydrolase I FolE [Woodsholea maritima]|uniref:GTP cyclohydrolase I FolE n=1 Tax=Woodsholea maritima TaxID=240237 RepID=UPI00035FA564|nr:GTP cyclohydrolase I FolE [Woodsholea maritima]